MSKRKEHVIWEDTYFMSTETIDAWAEDIKSTMAEEEAEGLNKYDLWERIDEDNGFYLDDEKCNLDQDAGRIVAFADIGTWRGRVPGYKVFDGYNLNNIFDLYGCDYNRWYSDGYNICWEGVHHDGRNYVTFREIRRDLTGAQLDRFEQKLADGKLTDRDIRRYTVSLLPRVKAVYGWR